MFNILTSITSTSLPSTSVENNITNNVSWVDVIVKYSVLVLIIFISLILIALVRRYFRKEASVKRLKNKCEKAKTYALKIKDKVSKQDLIIASAKLNKLTSLLKDATWIAMRCAEDKKDIILDEIASSLDVLATSIANYAEEAFYTKKDYQEKVNHVIKDIENIKKRIEVFEKDTKKE